MFREDLQFYDALVSEEPSPEIGRRRSSAAGSVNVAGAICSAIGAPCHVPYHHYCRNYVGPCRWRPWRFARHRCSRVAWRAEAGGERPPPHRASQARRRSRTRCPTRRWRTECSSIPWTTRHAPYEREDGTRHEREESAHHERAPGRPSSNQCRQSARRPAGPAMGAPAVVRQGGRRRCTRQRHLGNHRRHRTGSAIVRSLLVLVEQQQDARLLGLLRSPRVTLVSRLLRGTTPVPSPGSAAQQLRPIPFSVSINWVICRVAKNDANM